MKGSEAKLVSYMQGSDKRFIIPVYQRNYDYVVGKKIETETLLKDLLDYAKWYEILLRGKFY